jgi:hypothetical protein
VNFKWISLTKRKKKGYLNQDIRASGQFPIIYFSKWNRYKFLLLLFGDILALANAWTFARYLNHFYSPVPEALIWWVWFGLPSFFWIFSLVIIISFGSKGLYSGSTNHSQNYIQTAKLISLVYLLALLLIYFYDPKLAPPRSLFFTSWLASLLTVMGYRIFLSLFLSYRGIWPMPRVLVFVIGSPARLSAILEERTHYLVVGSALADMATSQETFKAIIDSKAQEVLLENLPNIELASALYWSLRRVGITLRLLPSSREMLYRRGIPEIFAGIPTLRVEHYFLTGWDYRVKRWLDIISSLVLLLLLMPLFILVSLAIKLSSPGPIFFSQERVGLHGKVFKMWKFRTMVKDAQSLQQQLEQNNQNIDGVMFKLKHDPRIIPIGHFLRKFSLDELPQLFNVLTGQMSLVGPRPLPIRDVERFGQWHHLRHQVLPGITGLWQISGRSDLSRDFNDVAKLDLYYIDNWSLNLDLTILIETIRVVIFPQGAY